MTSHLFCNFSHSWTSFVMHEEIINSSGVGVGVASTESRNFNNNNNNTTIYMAP